MTVAALYVDPKGTYSEVPDVELWGLPGRDARHYAGPHPVVAHPPCGRWCRLAGLVAARYPGRPDLQPGQDGGCFRAALDAVRRCGGVLEHPAYSDAWPAHDLLSPPTGGGWVNADFYGGWTCYVEQHRYGHPAKKATYLYAVAPTLPQLRWGLLPDTQCELPVQWRLPQPPKRMLLVSWCGNRTKADDTRPRLGKRAASATPPAFRDVLLDIARSCL